MISIPIINHTTDDPDETFMVTLSPPAGAARQSISTTGAPAPTEQETITIEDGADLQPLQVVSRKLHNGVPFDIDLGLAGAADEPTPVECRSGGPTKTHQVVFAFAEPVTLTGANVILGTGQVSSISGSGTTEVTVNLTAVTDAQIITLALLGVSDGVVTSDISVDMGVLLGDSTGNGTVNSGDAIQARNRSGQSLDPTNFRSDFNLDGSINSGDAVIVRARSGKSIF